MRELEHLLPELVPPSGGLQRLQRSLHARQEPKRTHIASWLPATAGVCALAVLAMVWLPGMIERERGNEPLTQALLRATTPPELTDGIHVDNGVALLLPGGQANARVYLIASSPAGH